MARLREIPCATSARGHELTEAEGVGRPSRERLLRSALRLSRWLCGWTTATDGNKHKEAEQAGEKPKPIVGYTAQGEKVTLPAGEISWADEVVSWKDGNPAPDPTVKPEQKSVAQP